MADTDKHWWKWGDPKKSFHLDDFPRLKNFLEGRWGKELSDDLTFPNWISKVPESSFTKEEFGRIFPGLKENQYSSNKIDRLKNGVGKSYNDIIQLLEAEDLHLPGLILYPESQSDVEHILKQANEHRIVIITRGGGSNVTGAAKVENKENRSCALNMQRLNKLVEIDTVSHTAVFEAGIYGPDLEKTLNEKGFTLGHFPQSFEFSTLGGWLATRSAGQESGHYGKIEDMVLGIEAATPKGMIRHSDYPRHASGIDIYPLFIGSEGTLGVIVRAQMRLHPLPERHGWIVAIFKDF